LFIFCRDCCFKEVASPEVLESYVERMPSFGLKADKVTYNILLKCNISVLFSLLFVLIPFLNFTVLAYAKYHRFQDAIKLLETLNGRGFKPDVFSFGALTKALAYRPSWPDYLRIKQFFGEYEIEPNIVVYNNLVSCLIKLEKRDELKELVARMSSKLEPNTETFNLLLDVYCHSKDFSKVHQVMEAMIAGNYPFSVVSYRLFMELFIEMKQYSKVLRYSEFY
jgi:pentatricopeptide repeat protein